MVGDQIEEYREKRYNEFWDEHIKEEIMLGPPLDDVKDAGTVSTAEASCLCPGGGDGDGNRISTSPLGSGDVLTGSLAAASAVGVGLERAGEQIGEASVGIKLTSAGRALGTTSTIATGLVLINEGQQYNEGQISGTRFSYHTASFMAEVMVGAMWGGYAGMCVGAGLWGMEKAYDGLMWYAGELSRYSTNFNNNAWKMGGLLNEKIQY